VPLHNNAGLEDKNQDQAADEHAADDHAQDDADAHAAGDGSHDAGEDHDAPPDAMGFYLDPGHLFDHVQDATYFEVPKFIKSSGHLNIPNPLGFTKETPMIGTAESPPHLKFVGQPTKYMVLEFVSAVLIAVVFIWLARKVASGRPPKGKIWNMLESVVLFIRDDVARPSIGKADADRYMPFLLSLFFFVLVLNLLGMIPFMGSATASVAVTTVLALVTFAVVLGAGIKKMGVAGFVKAQAPHIEMTGIAGAALTFSIWCIEMFGLFIKHFVLSIRLFANMFAGHLVLAMFVAFIGVTWGTALVWGVAPSVVLFSIALSMLELFVAFLQAYVFVFLAALFIGMALHPH